MRKNKQLSVQEKLNIATKALEEIAGCKHADAARYIRFVDETAIDALIAMEGLDG